MSKRPEKTVKVAELKAQLSAYLRAARRGQAVTICDRDTPVARLIPVDVADALVVRPRSTEVANLQAVPLPLPLRSRGDAVALLLADRASGR